MLMVKGYADLMSERGGRLCASLGTLLLMRVLSKYGSEQHGDMHKDYLARAGKTDMRIKVSGWKVRSRPPSPFLLRAENPYAHFALAKL